MPLVDAVYRTREPDWLYTTTDEPLAAVRVRIPVVPALLVTTMVLVVITPPPVRVTEPVVVSAPEPDKVQPLTTRLYAPMFSAVDVPPM